MKWLETCEQLPTHSRPIILDCEEGVGEGYYKGNETFRFVRFGIDVNADDVYRWAEMPKSEYMGYVIVDNKKYKITEIEGDEVYYRDEYGIEHAVSIH